MKLHIFGASGTGVTTLGQALGEILQVPYFDSDAYYWEPSEPPFTVRRPAEDRNAALAHDLGRAASWILGGSMQSWASQWVAQADLVVFLWLPPALRLARLQRREQARYGEAIRRDPARTAQAQAFLTWAAGYDDGSCGGSRTLANHSAWLSQFTCPVVEMRDDWTVAQRLAQVQAKLHELRLT